MRRLKQESLEKEKNMLLEQMELIESQAHNKKQKFKMQKIIKEISTQPQREEPAEIQGGEAEEHSSSAEEE